MKKKHLKYLIPFLLLATIFGVYKYSKPKVFLIKEITEKNIPIKIDIYRGNNSFGDSIGVYVPYKFKIQNNRLRKIGIGQMYYPQMKDVSGQDYGLYYDEDGNLLFDSERRPVLDSLLQEKKYLRYFKLKNINIILPFTSKTVYYYKFYKLNKNILEKGLSRQEYVDISESFQNKQRKNLFSEATISLSPKIIDSLYESDKKENLLFTFVKSAKYGSYKIKYKLSNNEQKFFDYYDIIKKMNRKELSEYLNKPVYEE